MFIRRDTDGDDDWLQAKLWIFTIGAVLALLGIGLGHDWLIAAAMVVLAAGFLLRFFRRPPAGSEADAEAEDRGQ